MKHERNTARPIGIRPGPGLGQWVADFASHWKLSRGEALRRLAILAALEFHLIHYETLHQLSETAEAKYGSRREAFWIVCSSARRRIDEAAREHGLGTLNPGDVERALMRTLDALRDAPTFARVTA